MVVLFIHLYHVEFMLCASMVTFIPSFGPYANQKFKITECDVYHNYKFIGVILLFIYTDFVLDHSSRSVDIILYIYILKKNITSGEGFDRDEC